MGRLLSLVDRQRGKRWARALIEEFGSIGSVLAAQPEALERVVGTSKASEIVGLVSETMRVALRGKACAEPVVSSSRTLLDYLSTVMVYGDVEEVRAIYLNGQNRLLRDELVGRGSVSEALLCPRTILKRALELNATALILVHNHPSGDSTPSRADLEVTARIASAARALDVTLHDHLIVARDGCTSLRALGYV